MKTNEFKQSNLNRHILFIFGKIISERKRSDKTFEEFFRSNPLNDFEKDYIVQYVYYLVKNYRFFKEILGKLAITAQDEMEALFTISMILAGKNVPKSAVLDGMKAGKVLEIMNELKSSRAIYNSFPDWIDETGLNELGSRWPKIIHSLNEEPYLVLRTNTLKTSRDCLRKKLENKRIETFIHPDTPDAIILKEKTNVFRLPEFREGLFEMQDISSQKIGLFSYAEPGMRVVDGCAGNGGKTLHLASLMKNKGRIIALDLYEAKLGNLNKRAKRAGVSIVETRTVENAKIIKRLHDSADLVLLDVPCSGLGVLKRNPEIKWNLLPSDLVNLRKTQQDILERYSLMVKPGGRLVYSTCSILPSENNKQIRSFLENNPSFEFREERFISPEEGFDGFYMASLRRLA